MPVAYRSGSIPIVRLRGTRLRSGRFRGLPWLLPWLVLVWSVDVPHHNRRVTGNAGPRSKRVRCPSGIVAATSFPHGSQPYLRVSAE